MAVYRENQAAYAFYQNKALSNKSEPSMKRKRRMSSCLASAVGATFLVLRLAIFLKISYTVKGVIFTYEIHILFHLRSGATTVVLQGVDEKKRKIKTKLEETQHGSNFYETITRSRRTLWSPNSSLEPKMKKYIFTERNGIYIIDLQKQ